MNVIRACAANGVFAQQAGSRRRATCESGYNASIAHTRSTTSSIDSPRRCSCRSASAARSKCCCRIQALIDGNPHVTDDFLLKQIHSISDDTHRQINALLTDHQLMLVQQMQARMREEGRGRYIDSLRNR